MGTCFLSPKDKWVPAIGFKILYMPRQRHEYLVHTQQEREKARGLSLVAPQRPAQSGTSLPSFIAGNEEKLSEAKKNSQF